MSYMARLGGFSFSIDTAAFQELQRVSSYRWEAKNRIGRKPAQQNVGQGADTISLNGIIYPHYRGGLTQLGAMRAQAATGEALPLIYAFESVGQYCGLWCITSIEEKRTVFFANGAPRRIDFALSLIEYGEDGLAAGALGQAAAIASAGTVGISASSAASQAATVQAAAAAVTTQDEALGLVPTFASTAESAATTISTGINSVLNSDAVRLARTAVTEFGAMTSAAAGLTSAARSVAGIVESPLTALTALGNLSAAAGTVADLLGSAAGKMTTQATAFNGSSPASLHAMQSSSAAASMATLSATASSLKSAALSLRALF